MGLPVRGSRDHRFEDAEGGADRFAHYLELQAQGVSQRQAAQELQVPRTTLQAWRIWHDSLDICPHVAEYVYGEKAEAVEVGLDHQATPR